MWGLGEDGGHTRVLIPAEGSAARNPAFDVTPAEYVTGFITEKGLIEPPYRENIAKKFG
jgi:methylthioribose-1-phosphate isomerase